MLKNLMSRIRILGTEIKLDWGSIIHLIFGMMAILLRQEWLFTVIFLFKQAIDVYGGEPTEEASGDIAEYCTGLTAGMLAKVLMQALS